MSTRVVNGREQLLLFTLDEPRYALPLAAVERVVRAVEITPLPDAPEIILGVIDAQGRVIPVVDVRRRFRLPVRGVRPDDRFIIARTARRFLALAVDDVTGIRECAGCDLVSAAEELPFAGCLRGVAKREDGLILITDLDAFLSLDEERLLESSLTGARR